MTRMSRKKIRRLKHEAKNRYLLYKENFTVTNNIREIAEKIL